MHSRAVLVTEDVFCGRVDGGRRRDKAGTTLRCLSRSVVVIGLSLGMYVPQYLLYVTTHTHTHTHTDVTFRHLHCAHLLGKNQNPEHWLWSTTT